MPQPIYKIVDFIPLIDLSDETVISYSLGGIEEDDTVFGVVNLGVRY